MKQPVQNDHIMRDNISDVFNQLNLIRIVFIIIMLGLASCSGGDSGDSQSGDDTVETDQPDLPIEDEIDEDLSPSFIMSESGFFVSLIVPDEISLSENMSQANMKIITNLIYEQMNDDFDFIFIVSNNEDKPDDITYFGRNFLIKNSVEGIGRNIFDSSSLYGSAGKLKSAMHLPARDLIKNGPSLHEVSHNWANGIITTDNGHWNYTGFDGGEGQLGGYDAGGGNNLQVESGSLGGGGVFSAPSFGTFANGGNSVPYNDVELYLMGLVVKPTSNIYLAENPEFEDFDSATQRLSFTADSVSITPFDDYLVTEGIVDRNPTMVNAQKSFKVLTVLVSHKKPLDDEMETVDDAIQWFSLDGPDASFLYNFSEATGFRATVEAGNLELSIK